MSVLSRFSKSIYEKKKKKGLTQQQVADAVSISVRWYQYIEKESARPSAEVMLKIMMYLDIDIDSLREEVNNDVSLYSR